MAPKNGNEGLSRALIWAIALHIVVLLAFFVGIDLFHDEPPSRKVVQAVLVNDSATKQMTEQQRLAEEKKVREQELEKEKRRQEEQEKQRQLRQEEEKKAKQAARQQEEQQRKEEAERKRKAEEEKRRKADAERKRNAEEERKRSEEAERKAAEERERKQAEAQRKAEEERQRKLAEEKARAEREAATRRALEEEMAREMASELEAEQAARARAERNRMLAGEIARYQDLVRKKVQSNWLKPPGAPDSFQCLVWVRLIPSGQIINVELRSSCGDAVLDESVLRAVRKSDPLPHPSEFGIPENEINFIFKPKG